MKNKFVVYTIVLWGGLFSCSSPQNTDFTWLLKPSSKYDHIASFKEGLAMVTSAKQSGYINTRGKEVISLQYDDAGDFHQGIALVKKNGKYGGINTKGEVVIPLRYKDLFINSSKGLGVGTLSDKYVLIDISTQKYTRLQRGEIDADFEEIDNIVRKGDKWGFLYKQKHKWVFIPLEFEYVQAFQEELAVVGKHEKYGLIDRMGRKAIPLHYDFVNNFQKGLAAARREGKYGFINTKGKETIAFEYNFANNFQEGLAVVGKGEKFGFIDMKGEEVVPVKYDDAWGFVKGKAWVKKGSQWLCIDKKGKVLAQANFEKVGQNSEGFVPVKLDGKWGVIQNP